MKNIFLVILTLLLTTGTLQFSEANGRNPNQSAQSTGEYAGVRCSTPKTGSGIVAGFFRGWKQTTFQMRGNGYMPVESYRCFKTMSDCQSWLKTMTYLYNEKTIDANICTQY